jgi:MinD superfamily P-loop ATPase
VGALSWYASGQPPTLQAFAVREVLSAARRGHDTVVVDLPRGADPLVDEIVSRCDRLLVMVVPTVPGLAGAVRMCRRFADHGVLGAVVRGGSLDDEALRRLTGVPVVARMSDQRGLAESIDLGLGPVRSRRGPLGRAAAAVLAQRDAAVRAA